MRQLQSMYMYIRLENRHVVINKMISEHHFNIYTHVDYKIFLVFSSMLNDELFQ